MKAIEFIASNAISFKIYLPSGLPYAVRFDVMSNGKGTFFTKDMKVAKGIIKTQYFAKGFVKLENPDDMNLLIEPVASKNVETPVVKENLTTEVAEPENIEPVQGEGVNEVVENIVPEVSSEPTLENKEFSDVADAKDFLKGLGAKAVDIRSLKGIKEQGVKFGYNIIIEE